MSDAVSLEWGAVSCVLNAAEFERIRRLAYDHFGLDLRQGKEELVRARLGRQIRKAKLLSFDEYCRYVMADRTGQALAVMIDSLTTNFTGFFREPGHFEFFREEVLPRLRSRSLVRFWSAACATGEEPYTLAMCILEELGGAAATRAQIVATDFSTRALEVARQGIYTTQRCDGIPAALARRYLLRGEGDRKGWFRVKPELCRMVQFRRLNLIEGHAHLGAFSLILCRNVMIYFDRPTRERLVRRIVASLEPGGYLFVGHAESLTGLEQPLAYVRPAIYRKPDGGRGPAKP